MKNIIIIERNNNEIRTRIGSIPFPMFYSNVKTFNKNFIRMRERERRDRWRATEEKKMKLIRTKQ